MVSKFLIAIMATSLTLGDPEGWVDVQVVPKAEEAMSDEDRSIWVLYVKNRGDEKFSVQFPTEPVVDGATTRAILGEELFELTALSAGDSLVASLYMKEGKWVREQIVHATGKIYRLRTQSPDFESPNSDHFFSSFSFFS